MISYNNVEITESGKRKVEIECLSTDTKPTDIANGSLILEMDTGDVYAFDEAGAQWLKL